MLRNRLTVIFLTAGLLLASLTVTTLLSTHIVGPGHVGVVTHWGAVQPETLPEGLHTLVPGKSHVHDIDVRVQKLEMGATASSRDLQIVRSQVALNYFVNKEHASTVFQTLGEDFVDTVVGPSLQESVKAATAQFTAEQLITKRPAVKDAILIELTSRLGGEHLVVTDFSIVDFKFSEAFNRAIEEKQVAEQMALRAENDLDRIRIEATQAEVQALARANARRIEAAGESEANLLLSKDLNREVLALRAMEKWDGKLPEVMSGTGEGLFVELAVGK
jgi:prohibitin 2